MPRTKKTAANSAADAEGTTSNVFEKDFVVVKAYWQDDDYANEANIENTRESAIHAGFHPTEHGEKTGEDDHEDGVSLVLHYEVATEPASEDREGDTRVIEDPEQSSGELATDGK